jgi:hypothetical protein
MRNVKMKSAILALLAMASLYMTSGVSALYAQDAENTFHGIPVEVTGIPYAYKDICGNRLFDDLMESEYNMMTTGQISSFVNFTIHRFVCAFQKDGGLIISAVYSYDKTQARGGSSYPGVKEKSHDWRIRPKYHTHGGRRCSPDLYNEIAVAQAALNEMRKDPSLAQVYDMLLSVAEDMDYNYPAIGRPARFVKLPNGQAPLKGVCEDYADLLIDRLTEADIKGVSDIQKVSGQNHAWVTLMYAEKTLYLDATWFDANSIDNGVVDHVPYKDPCNMTFDEEIFTNHNKHHIAGK